MVRPSTVLPIHLQVQRQRDIFPLPLPDAARAPQRTLSRGTRQRVARRAAADTWMRAGIETLNRCAGRGDVAVGCTAAQSLCLRNLEDAYQAMGPPPAGLGSGEEVGVALFGILVPVALFGRSSLREGESLLAGARDQASASGVLLVFARPSGVGAMVEPPASTLRGGL